MPGERRERHTIDGLALCHVGVVCASQQAVAVATDNALDVAANMGSLISIESKTGWGQFTYPLFTLKKRPSMIALV